MTAAPGRDEEDDILSLRHHLVNWLFTPLYLLLLFSTVTGYIAALKLSNQPYDLVLTERARLMASRFDLIPEAEPVTEADLVPEDAEHLSFTLFDAGNRPLLGNASLPRPRPIDFAATGPLLRNTSLAGEKVRVLTLHFRTTRRTPGTEYVLVMAEPVKDRLFLGRSILGNIVIPQFIFILIAGLAVWLGLKRGFEPLERLRRAVARRRSDDLSPLDEAMAPGEVRPLIREVNALIERLKAMMDQQRRFVANAAHQLRTPFAGLRAQAELARRAEAPPGVHAALDGICEGADRCSRLVNQLLTLARNEPEARAEEGLTDLDLNRIAQETTMDWVPEAVRKDIDLGFEGAVGELPLRGYDGALRDLIGNLLDNAIRYTSPGGRVTLRTGPGPWLRVEDNGPGIAPEERTKVFDRFYRVAGSGQPGSGLGLAIVHEVAQRHHARIAVEAGEGGKGTVFRVDFNVGGR
ncbi:sensor histidine kinase [Parasulfuritortus cantonensis]|uniref:histidine kinase n=1 Tax=Parasulfuritortus cantonensis TaxID=2528202 RepID=A0A4R1B7Z3_9PROT|nr:sensor histidine kinase [Parasulfuritortus cantonensis]TCJ12848.1 sensor histidine kinase [Parasulfuritortus cantonensis]